MDMVQQQLNDFWKDEDYPNSFNEMPLPHRHYNHALSHAMKALGGLAALSDAMDHERMFSQDPEVIQLRENAGKWLADLVICAARMSQQLNLSLRTQTDKRIETLTERWR